jgi:NitT/TauT family transport system substrate-binding protein
MASRVAVGGRVRRAQTRRRARLAVGGVVAAALVAASAPLAAASGNSRKSGGTVPLTVVLAWYPTAEYGGLYAAEANHYFSQAGIQLKITPGGPNVNPVPILAGNRAQVGFGGSEATVLTADETTPDFVEIATEFEKSPEGVEYHKSHPITSFSQVSDHTLLVAPGDPSYEWIANKYHLHNVKLGPFNYSLFRRDPGDLEYGFVSDDLPTLAASGTSKVGYLLPSDYGFNENGDVLFTTSSYLDAHRSVLRKFIVALQKGWRYYATHYHAVDQVIYQQDKSIPVAVEDRIARMERSFVFSGTARTKGIAYISPSHFVSVYDTMKSLKVVTKPLTARKFVDPLSTPSIRPPVG